MGIHTKAIELLKKRGEKIGGDDREYGANTAHRTLNTLTPSRSSRDLTRRAVDDLATIATHEGLARVWAVLSSCQHTKAPHYHLGSFGNEFVSALNRKLDELEKSAAPPPKPETVEGRLARLEDEVFGGIGKPRAAKR